MSGLVKAKKYDWKDSNMALFGSDTEKNVKKESAETEPAWKHAGEKPGLQIWRIEKFQVKPLPTHEYSKFYSGDSYIILNTYKEEDSDQLLYDIHFWIGKYSTQDEYGTAAYKTVELDTLLDDKPVQHREVQDNESDLFKTYFEHIQILSGGADSGFRHVKPEEYKPRLLHVTGTRKNVTVTEVTMRSENVTSNDVFILDRGLEIYQWNGCRCSKDEKYKAVQYLQKIKSERGGKPESETLDEEEEGDSSTTRFLSLFDREDEKEEQESTDVNVNTIPTLHKLSDSEGSLEMTQVMEGRAFIKHFNSNDVFIYDTAKELFVWVGKKASKSERKNAMTYGHNFANKSANPLKPITCVSEGKESKTFRAAVSA